MVAALFFCLLVNRWGRSTPDYDTMHIEDPFYFGE